MLSEQLRDKYTFDISLVTVGMMGSILMAIAMAAAMAAHQIVEAARMPTIRLQSTKAPPDLPLAKGHIWHMFLSHIWGTGQDQCATIKRQFKIILPGASVFLDVDDLQSIDALEEYIESSAVITIFVSKGYFLSKSKLTHTVPHHNPQPQCQTLAHIRCCVRATQTASARCTAHWHCRSPCALCSTQCEAARRSPISRPSAMQNCSLPSLGRLITSVT